MAIRTLSKEPYDVVIVGGGPVGLYAGFRSALLLLRVCIVDKGQKWSRGFHVPKFHNIPSQHGGIAGKDVINKLRRRIALQQDYANIEDFVTIQTITIHNDLFMLRGVHNPTKIERTYTSRAVVLATGIVDKQPAIRGEIKPVLPYANKQLLCYCALCDGHLVKGKEVAVIGNGKLAVLTARDLSYFKAKTVTILTHGKELFARDDESKDGMRLRKIMKTESIDVVTAEITSLFGIENDVFGVRFAGGNERIFGIAFSAMGFYRMNNDLADMLGGKIDEVGYVVVDQDCKVLDKSDKPIPGLYAVGDITQNWNQLMIGFGSADKAIIDIWANYL